MIIDFTKIEWAGDDVILITDREHCRVPILILDRHDIKKLNEEWNEK